MSSNRCAVSTNTAAHAGAAHPIYRIVLILLSRPSPKRPFAGFLWGRVGRTLPTPLPASPKQLFFATEAAQHGAADAFAGALGTSAGCGPGRDGSHALAHT